MSRDVEDKKADIAAAFKRDAKTRLFKVAMISVLDDDIKELAESSHINPTNMLLIQLCRNTGGIGQ